MTDAQLGSSHLTPAPIGSSFQAKIEQGDSYSAPEIFDVEITILEVLRGNEASRMMGAQRISDVTVKDGFGPSTVWSCTEGKGIWHRALAVDRRPVCGGFACWQKNTIRNLRWYSSHSPN